MHIRRKTPKVRPVSLICFLDPRSLAILILLFNRPVFSKELKGNRRCCVWTGWKLKYSQSTETVKTLPTKNEEAGTYYRGRKCPCNSSTHVTKYMRYIESLHQVLSRSA